MFFFKIIVDKVLDLPDIPYSMHNHFRCYACRVVAEYEDGAFHGYVRLW